MQIKFVNKLHEKTLTNIKFCDKIYIKVSIGIYNYVVIATKFLERTVMSKVFVVTSGKGGTGKSTVAASLGVAFAKRNKRVLLIDCDSGMRGLDIMLGVSKGLVFDIADAVSGNCKTEHIVYPCTHTEGLYLIPAPQKAEDELSPEVLSQFIESVENQYDIIIIDSPAGVGKGFETAVYPAEVCLVVANPEPTSVRGCLNVRKRLMEFNKDNIRLVINRLSKRNFFKLNFYSDLDAIIDETQIQLIGVVPESTQVVAAIQKGIVCTDDSKALIAFDRIAGRLEGESLPLVVC